MLKKGGRKSANERPVAPKSFVDIVLMPNSQGEENVYSKGKQGRILKSKQIDVIRNGAGFSTARKINFEFEFNRKGQRLKKSVSAAELKSNRSQSKIAGSWSIPQLPVIKLTGQSIDANINLPSTVKVPAKGFQGYKISTLYTNRSLIKSNFIRKTFN